VKHALKGIAFEVQATTRAELAYEEILAKVRKFELD